MDLNLRPLIWTAIAAILFTVLMMAVADQTTTLTNAFPARNVSISMAAGRLPSGNMNSSYMFNITPTNVVGGLTLYNGSDTWTQDTDYNNTANTLYFLNTTRTRSATNNATNITYSFYPSGYINDTPSRSLVSLIVLFIAIGVIGGVLYGIWPYIADIIGA